MSRHGDNFARILSILFLPGWYPGFFFSDSSTFDVATCGAGGSGRRDGNNRTK